MYDYVFNLNLKKFNWYLGSIFIDKFRRMLRFYLNVLDFKFYVWK